MDRVERCGEVGKKKIMERRDGAGFGRIETKKKQKKHVLKRRPVAENAFRLDDMHFFFQPHPSGSGYNFKRRFGFPAGSFSTTLARPCRHSRRRV